MPGINLAQGARQEAVQKKEKRSRRGTWIVFLFLMLVLGAWGGLVWYENMLVSDIDRTQHEIDATWGEISGTDLSRVADFYFRLEAIEEGLENAKRPHLLLSAVETNIDAGVVLSSFQFDESDDGVMLQGRAEEFQAIVRQLVALKSASDVSSVSLQDLKRNEDGKFDFTLSVRVVKQ